MARTADKAGSWRIIPKAGRFLLTGVDASGERIKIRVGSRDEGERKAALLFPSTSHDYPRDNPPLPQSNAFNDWGYPSKATEDTVGGINQSMGVNPTIPIAPTPLSKEEKAAQDKVENHKLVNNTRAKSLCELAGVAWVGATVWSGGKLCDMLDCERVKPNTMMGAELKKTTYETLVETFGDMEVKPWIMWILLSLGIPIAMVVQARKLTPEQIAERDKAKSPAKLQSVP